VRSTRARSACSLRLLRSEATTIGWRAAPNAPRHSGWTISARTVVVVAAS
jgi:hypothetical protein